jgi:hypothetical protein
LESDREFIKTVFFLAGALKEDLNEIHPRSRSLFMTVTQSDGRLGFNSTESFQEAIGLTGVVKTLHWEWQNVFCRAVDLDPNIDVIDQVDYVIQEIHDPDRGLLEVGITQNERVTIDRDLQDIS